MRTKLSLKFVYAFIFAFFVGVIAQAQSVPFTGFVDQDFQGKTYIPDTQAFDLLMAGPLANRTSGWDMRGLALNYDKSSDKLQVGIDAHGVCGDADGNGNPSTTSYFLYMSGGIDRPNFSGGETFAVCFDLDDDGQGDVIAGIPIGGDVNQFRVAEILPGVSLSQSFMAFGNSLPDNNGGILGSPVASCPDLEFSLANFCDLINDYGQLGQTHIGIHVFLGSFDDAMIPEDFIAGQTNDDFLRVPIDSISGGIPIVNNFSIDSVVLENNYWKFQSSYTKPEGFVACLLFSLIDNPSGTYLGAPYDMTILVGNGTESSIVMEEFNAPITALPCEYFVDNFYGPIGLENMTFFAQAFQFRAQYDAASDVNFLASNRVVIGPSFYPTIID